MHVPSGKKLAQVASVTRLPSVLIVPPAPPLSSVGLPKALNVAVVAPLDILDLRLAGGSRPAGSGVSGWKNVERL